MSNVTQFILDQINKVNWPEGTTVEVLKEPIEEAEEVEEFMCPECKEWTTSDEPCCGVGPGRYNEDSLNGDR